MYSGERIWLPITKRVCFNSYQGTLCLDLVINCLEHLRPDLVIHRVTGDGPRELLIAPLWSCAKRSVLNDLHRRMRERGAFQGRLYLP